MPDLQQQVDDLRRRVRALPDSPDAGSVADLERSARGLLTDAKNTPYESEAQALFAELARASTPQAVANNATQATVRGLLRRARIRVEIAGDDEDIDEAIDILAQALELSPQDSDVAALLDDAARHDAQAARRVSDLFARHNIWRPTDAEPPARAGSNGDAADPRVITSLTPPAGVAAHRGDDPPPAQPSAGYIPPPREAPRAPTPPPGRGASLSLIHI